MSPLFQDQALNALLDLGGVHGSVAQVEQAAKFLQSLVALREEDGVGALAEAAREEALGGRGEKMLASSWAAEGSTDSQTSLTEEATATRKVPAAASALNEGFQQRGPKIRTRRDSTKTQDVTHGLPKQRRFMVYICGGYRGNTRLLCVSFFSENGTLLLRQWFPKWCHGHEESHREKGLFAQKLEYMPS